MDSAFKKLIYWSGHTHSLLGLAVHQLYLQDIVNQICLGDVSVNGVDKLGMSVNEKQHRGNLQMRKSSWLVVESG